MAFVIELVCICWRCGYSTYPFRCSMCHEATTNRSPPKRKSKKTNSISILLLPFISEVRCRCVDVSCMLCYVYCIYLATIANFHRHLFSSPNHPSNLLLSSYVPFVSVFFFFSFYFQNEIRMFSKYMLLIKKRTKKARIRTQLSRFSIFERTNATAIILSHIFLSSEMWYFVG